MSIEVACEGCGKEFSVDLVDAEEIGKENQSFLCPECQVAEAIPEPRQRFEYVADIMYADTEQLLMALNDRGSEGWELIAVVHDRLVFKRGYFE